MYDIPLSPDTIAHGAITVTKAGEAIVRLIMESRARNRPVAADDVIRGLVGAAKATSTQQLSELRAIRNQLINSNVDLTMTATQIVADASFFKLRQYRAIRSFRNRINALVDNMGDAYQELVTLSHCREAEEIVALSSSDVAAEATRRRASLTSNTPLGNVIEGLIQDAEALDHRLIAL